ncbi:MAG: hypothetical protein IT331_06360 [Anaerolineae bacterium]|nr:hypothetical protein [Anaerolineae bacterium]
MKVRYLLVGMFVLVAVLVSGCGLVESLTGSKGGTVSSLWSDVPPLANASKADIPIPPLVNIIITGFIQAANADNSSDMKLDKFDFIVYQTADTPEQVGNFYTKEKMAAAGWNAEDQPGCQVGAGQGVAGGFCAFGKKSGNTDTVLLILPVREDQATQTQVFFIRFEGTKKSS